MKALVVIGCLLLTVLVEPTVVAAEWTPEQQEIIAVMDRWQKAWNDGDITTIDRMLPDQIDVFVSLGLKKWSPAGDGVFKDKATLLKAAVGWIATQQEVGWQGQKINQRVTYVQVTCSGEGAAVVRKINWWITGGTGKLRSSGSFTSVGQLKKLNGEWKVYSGKQTDD